MGFENSKKKNLKKSKKNNEETFSLLCNLSVLVLFFLSNLCSRSVFYLGEKERKGKRVRLLRDPKRGGTKKKSNEKEFHLETKKEKEIRPVVFNVVELFFWVSIKSTSLPM